MSTLACKNVAYAYEKGKGILTNISFSFESGKMYAILGPSGSGKTTLLSLLGGLDTPAKGNILFDDTDITQTGLEEHRRNHISLIFQNYNLIDYMTPIENTKLVSKVDAVPILQRLGLTEDDLTELMMSMSGTQSASYDNNLQQLGYADFSQPSSISIYPKDFDNKEKVVEVLDHYNQKMEDEGKEEQVISYTDIVGTMMSSVTTIINTISYVLIAFVAISLIVSSIMIGVITYISVLERKKEIGILRAIGASKGNISQVFNAETFIIGLCAGLIGIGLTLLILIPGNMLIHALADNNRVSAILPIAPAIVLILLSVVLTLLGGLIPSRKAAKSDPVTALRTE